MPLQHRRTFNAAMRTRTVRYFLFSLLAIIFTGTQSLTLAETTPTKPPFHQSTQRSEGVFLVATENLHNSSFRQAVILLTHFSDRGATGLTINRPSSIPLRKALPGIKQLRRRTDPLYLGGPVNTNAIFVLLRTLQPNRSMHRIADDIYFSTGKNVFLHSLGVTENIATRTYAGYASWAAGQLQNEIDRGDWLMVHTNPNIIFEDNTEGLWQRLTKRWTGKWI